MVDYSLLSRGLGVQSNLNNTQNWGGYGYLSLESGLNVLTCTNKVLHENKSGYPVTCGDQEGDRGSGPPPEISTKYRGS